MADSSLLLHSRTRQNFEHFAKNPSHALLLSGASGSGKDAAANYLAATLLDFPLENLEKYPHLIKIYPIDTKGISIEQIRELNHSMALSIPGTNPVARIVIVSKCHSMSVEAQNAFLKTIEEPPDRTIIILTTDYIDSLLPTIRSRVQSITLICPRSDEVRQYFVGKGYDAVMVDQSLALSNGLPGLTQTLLESDKDHPLFLALENARTILRGTIFERIIMIDNQLKDKDTAKQVVDMLLLMSRATLRKSKGTRNEQSRWIKIFAASTEASNQFSRNLNTKLILTNLMLKL